MSKLLHLLTGGALLVVLALPTSAQIHYYAYLNGLNERPTPTDSTATGFGTVTLLGPNSASVTLEWEGLTGDAIAAHIHGPATPDQAAGVTFGFWNPPASSPMPPSGSFSTTWAITDQQLDWLRKGLLYMNIHTNQFRGGEIRGQIITPEPGVLAMLVGGLVPLALLARRRMKK
jgi:hypothetical protein